MVRHAGRNDGKVTVIWNELADCIGCMQVATEAGRLTGKAIYPETETETETEAEIETEIETETEAEAEAETETETETEVKIA